MEWTRSVDDVEAKWRWLDGIMDELAKGRLCFEHRCTKVSRAVIEIHAPGGLFFEAGFCREHAEQALRGLGDGWWPGHAHELQPGEILDGPAKGDGSP